LIKNELSAEAKAKYSQNTTKAIGAALGQDIKEAPFVRYTDESKPTKIDQEDDDDDDDDLLDGEEQAIKQNNHIFSHFVKIDNKPDENKLKMLLHSFQTFEIGGYTEIKTDDSGEKRLVTHIPKK